MVVVAGTGGQRGLDVLLEQAAVWQAGQWVVVDQLVDGLLFGPQLRLHVAQGRHQLADFVMTLHDDGRIELAARDALEHLLRCL
ncbi:hypothetical protein D3C71_1720570 [compost metagenome]